MRVWALQFQPELLTVELYIFVVVPGVLEYNFPDAMSPKKL